MAGSVSLAVSTGLAGLDMSSTATPPEVPSRRTAFVGNSSAVS
jgi:hypothetical protein